MKKNYGILVCALSFLLVVSLSFLIKDFSGSSTNYREEVSLGDTQNIIFEGVGNYKFVIAGNNNAKRATYLGAGDHSMIYSTPEDVDDISYDWNDVLERLNTDGITEISNMSGSYLDFEGNIKKAIFSIVASDVTSLTKPYSGRILIIRPNGDYFIINSTVSNWVDVIDLTSYFENATKGWYFVSYLDSPVVAQTAWSITCVAEHESYKESYIKLIEVNESIQNGGTSTVYLNSRYELKNDFQLVGVITGAGIAGIPNYVENSWQTTQDEAYIINEDDELIQIYDRGDGHFAGRSQTDFANGIFNTRRSHNLPGGELDIFDETFSKNSSLLNGKAVIGYHFKKVGTNIINISLLGLRQEVVIPDLNIETEMSPRDDFTVGSTILTTTTVTNNLDDGVCHIAYDNEIKVNVDNHLDDIRDIEATYNGVSIPATYNESTHQVIIRSSDLPQINCSSPVVLTYNSTVKSSIIETIEDNKYHLFDEASITFGSINNDENKVTLTDDDEIESPAKSILIVHHYIEGTTTNVPDATDEEFSYSYGESYETNVSDKVQKGYSFSRVEGNPSGTINSNLVEVTYYYNIDKCKIIVHHYLKGTTESLFDDEVQIGSYGDSYRTQEKEKEGYRVVTKPGKESGIYEDEVKELIYEYEKIKHNLSVEVIGGVGSITGEEDIYHGDDSTKDNIVIKPHEGYKIVSIIINGENYEVTNSDGMVLDNFIDVRNDIKVQVEFAEKDQPTPITGLNTRYLLLITVLLSFGLIFIIEYKAKINS